MPKKITIKFDGEKTVIESEGYVGMTCHNELSSLNLPFKVESETPMPNRGVAVGVGQKAKA